MRGNGGASIKNDAFRITIRRCHGRDEAATETRPPISGMGTRADGLLNDSIAETDPNYKAAKLISDMTSAKQVAAPSEGRAPASFAGPARLRRPFVYAVAATSLSTQAPASSASPSITFAARRKLRGPETAGHQGASEYHASPKKEKQSVDARPASLSPGSPTSRTARGRSLDGTRRESTTTAWPSRPCSTRRRARCGAHQAWSR